MTTQIALIRGINVGTSKRVPMAALRELLSGLGYQNVRTHLNSGNAVFSTPASADDVATAIETGLADEIGVSAKVVVRDRDQVVAAMNADPLESSTPDGSKHFLGFLASTPDPARVRAIRELTDGGATAPDEAKIVGNHLYLWCPNGISKSTFVKVNWDKQLGTAVTVRNWNTVSKLVDIAAD